MRVAVAATKVKTTKVMFLVFCSDCNNSNGKVNKRKPVYGKVIGIGSMMDNYAGCGSSCNSNNIG